MKKNNPTIAIAGCGWVGFPLGYSLSKDNFLVKGSVRHDSKIMDLKNSGIHPYLMDLPNEPNEQFFNDNDILIISIPAGTKSGKGDLYIDSIKEIVKQTNRHSPEISQVILLSSIGVYPNEEGTWTEESSFELKAEKQQIIRTAEKLIQENFSNSLILRLGGLMGYDRYLAKYYMRKEKIDIDQTPVNYVHRDDVVKVITKGIKEDQSGIYNVVAPEHPGKYEVLKNSAHSNSINLPSPSEKLTPENRMISGEKLIKEWNYRFKYPDPNKFWPN